MNKNNMIDLAIVTDEPFPIGMAATNRILSYAKVIAVNYRVKAYISKPTDDISKSFNEKPKGVVCNILFQYTNGYTCWPYHKTKIFKLGVLISGYINLIKHLYKDKPSVVLLYSESFILRMLTIFFKHIIKYKLFFEENEYPKILKKSPFLIVISVNLLLYRFIDGLIVMTEELLNYYKSIKIDNIFILPMTVDIKRFDLNKEAILDFEYFIYVGGSGGFKRDGVFNIVKSFSLFHKEFARHKLLIIGPISRKDKNYTQIQEFIAGNNLESHVIFLGIKPSHEIPMYLQNALGIIMAPPKNFTSGGFPTKLGEFLASGSPVISTKVSDIPLYLNSSNSFLTEPCNDVQIYEAMKFIELNRARAKYVGCKGKATANHVFNAETYKQELIEFLFGEMHA